MGIKPKNFRCAAENGGIMSILKILKWPNIPSKCQLLTFCGEKTPANIDISELHELLLLLSKHKNYRFILLCDDLSFDSGENNYKSLKAALDGGIEGKPNNVIFYATSNRRHLMPRDMMENERSTAINPSESVE